MTSERDTLTTLYGEHIAGLTREYALALDEAGLDAVVLHSGSQQKRTEADDQYWALRAVPHFQHWLPLAQPDCALVIRPGARPRLLWLKSTSYWERVPAPDSDHWLDAFDIVELTEPDAVRDYLPREGAAVIGERRAPPPWRDDLALNPEPLTDRLDKLRVLKSPYEVHCIAEANRRAALGHRRVAEAFMTGDHAELDLHLLFLLATRQDDPETPYKNIIALGPNAATLHHIAYGRTVARRPAESLLIDAGATYQGYTSDVTRTHVKGGGSAAEAFSALVGRVQAMQAQLCAEASVGLPFPELHERAHRYVSVILSELGVVRLPAEEVYSTGISRTFLPHGLGHSLGLQCHDVGCAEVPPTEETDWLRNTTTITTDQVFTIEPGVYFIEGRLAKLREGPHAGAVDWRLVDELAGLGGVRIEDDVHVAGPGVPVANLTRPHLP